MPVVVVVVVVVVAFRARSWLGSLSDSQTVGTGVGVGGVPTGGGVGAGGGVPSGAGMVNRLQCSKRDAAGARQARAGVSRDSIDPAGKTGRPAPQGLKPDPRE